jgi:two-component system, NtrC family, C4-dicarboxylate transport sensor histidine kinase DctB
VIVRSYWCTLFKLLQALHLIYMSGELSENRALNNPKERWRYTLWVSGIWVLPLLCIPLLMLHSSVMATTAVSTLAALLAPLPALLSSRRQRDRLLARAANAREEAVQLKLQLDTVRYRTTRLREELSAADRQARLSHQLTLLGQFTAGFMHEFNNPLAIVAGRIEVLLDEREEDAALCADLREMLKETRYMGNIARTLLQALRRERGGQIFEASVPGKALEDALAALRPSAENQGVRFVEEVAEVPRVDVPEHVVNEVVRGLVSNALEALKGRQDGVIWARLETYRTAGARVVARIEDNGPGLPENVREHLFEPFVSRSSGRERLGLGLFLAASLLDMYDARLRYEVRNGGGASFVIEMPPARFLRGQPYHWFTGGTPA